MCVCVCVCVCVCTCAGLGLPVHMFVKVCFGKTLKRPCFHEGALVLKQNLDFVGFPLLPHRYCIQLYSDKAFFSRCSVESTALRLITSLGSSEVQPQLSRIATESKGSQNILTGDSEELNRALVLTLARAMEITGMTWNRIGELESVTSMTKAWLDNYMDFFWV